MQILRAISTTFWLIYLPLRIGIGELWNDRVRSEGQFAKED